MYKNYKNYKKKYIELKRNASDNHTIKIIIPKGATKFGGLYNDALIYQKYLPGSQIVFSNDKNALNRSFVNLFLERVDFYNMMFTANMNIIMINQDLLGLNEYTMKIFHKFDILIAKSMHAVDVLKKHKEINNFKYKILYTKHTTFNDSNYESNQPLQSLQSLQSLQDERLSNRNYIDVFHGAGKSPFKSTDIVVKLWRKYNDLPHLYLICFYHCLTNLEKWTKLNIDQIKGTKNITYYDKPLDKEELEKLRSNIVCHLCPSYKEGYGHYINEARMNKCVIITVDGPPMNELVDENSGIIVKGTKEINIDFTEYTFIDEKSLYDALIRYKNMSIEEKIKMGENAYNRYIEDTNFFEDKMKQLYDYIKNGTIIQFE